MLGGLAGGREAAKCRLVDLVLAASRCLSRDAAPSAAARPSGACALRLGEQAGDQLRLGHVAPVLLRHLGSHRVEVRARRIEGRAVVGAPPVFQRVARRRVLARNAGRIGQFLAVPVQRALRREDRPAHRGEAADEEIRDAAQDEMLRLEPGDEMLAVLGLDAAEAQERGHLVHVAAHGFLHALQPVHQRIGCDREQLALAMRDAPEQFVEQREALGIAVAHDVLGKAHVGRRHAERDAAVRRRLAAEQIAGAARATSRPRGATSAPISPRAASRKSSNASSRESATRNIFSSRNWQLMRITAVVRAAARASRAGCADVCSATGRQSAAMRNGRARRIAPERRARSSSRSVRCLRATMIRSMVF